MSIEYTYDTVPITNSNNLGVNVGRLFNTTVLYMDVIRSMGIHTLDDLLKCYYSIRVKEGRPVGLLDEIPARSLNPMFKQLFLRLGIVETSPIVFSVKMDRLGLGLVRKEPERDYRRLIEFIGVVHPSLLDVSIKELTTRNRHNLGFMDNEVYTYGDLLLLIHKHPTTFRVPSGMTLATFNGYLDIIYRESGVNL